MIRASRTVCHALTLAVLAGAIFAAGGALNALTGCASWMPRKKVGNLAPKMSAERMYQGPRRAKADWMSLKGRAVVLTFWEPWDNGSIRAIPRLNEIAAAYEGAPVVFLYVTTETDDKVLEQFVATQPIDGWIAIDEDGSMFRDFAVGEEPPAVWLVNQHGVVIDIQKPRDLKFSEIRAALDGLAKVPINEGFYQ